MGSHTLRERTPSPVPRTREVLDAIRRIVQALRESSRLAESRVGLSGAQLFVLRTAAEVPGLSLNELAERTRTHQSSVSAVVTRLAREGLVQKRAADGDARRVESACRRAGGDALPARRSPPRSGWSRQWTPCPESSAPVWR